ncbi:hypothetical protein ACFXI8_23795 [Streptomyces niveus]|uniref:hypothetical protein n=1 Tax=Streptomyces niveus TaxID=193462 RepID=UPI0036A4090C
MPPRKSLGLPLLRGEPGDPSDVGDERAHGVDVLHAASFPARPEQGRGGVLVVVVVGDQEAGGEGLRRVLGQRAGLRLLDVEHVAAVPVGCMAVVDLGEGGADDLHEATARVVHVEGGAAGGADLAEAGSDAVGVRFVGEVEGSLDEFGE